MRFLRAFVLFPLVSASLIADVQIKNQSPITIDVAHIYYFPGSNGESAGDYNLGASTPAGWLHKGWFAVKPGQSINLRNGWFFFDQGGRKRSFESVRTTQGLVKRPFAYDFFINDGPNSSAEFTQKAREPGTSKEIFYLFKDTSVEFDN